MFAGLIFQFQPNPYGKYLFFGMWTLLIIWLMYGLVKEIIEFKKTEFDFEIVEEGGKWYSVMYVIYKGKKREVERRKIYG